MTEQADDGMSSTPLPEFDVWNHLESGLDTARSDLAKCVTPEVGDLLEQLALLILGSQRRLGVSAEDEWLRQAAGAVSADLSAVSSHEFATSLVEMFASERLPLLSYAVELEIGKLGVKRATGALRRAKALMPALGVRDLPPSAQPYLEQVADTYLFGFDAACIALCRSSFEQLAKAALVNAGIVSEPYIEATRPTAGTLEQALTRGGLLHESTPAARRLVANGNRVMHRSFHEARILEQTALDCVTDLLAVVRELC